MAWLDFLFPSDTDTSDSDFDPDLLCELGQYWLDDATQEDNEIADYKLEAVEHIEEESSGGFWSWFAGG